MDTAQVRRQVKPIRHDVEECDTFYETRMPSSVRRYKTTPPLHDDVLDEERPDLAYTSVQRRASRSQKMPAITTQTATMRATRPQHPVRTTKTHIRVEPHTETLPRTHHTPIVAILVGIVLMIVLFMSISAIGTWWQSYQDDLHYGRPRTSQMDAVVGHNDSPGHPTHFIFLNLNRHVEIIEIPGGDASKMRVYMGPVLFGDGQDLAPVTGEIRNDNGRKDLLVHIQNQEILFINDGTTFHAK